MSQSPQSLHRQWHFTLRSWCHEWTETTSDMSHAEVPPDFGLRNRIRLPLPARCLSGTLGTASTRDLVNRHHHHISCQRNKHLDPDVIFRRLSPSASWPAPALRCNGERARTAMCCVKSESQELKVNKFSLLLLLSPHRAAQFAN